MNISGSLNCIENSINANLKSIGFNTYAIISDNIVSVDLAKTEAIGIWLEPSSVHGLQYFIGLENYYNGFIPNIATIAASFTDLLKTGKKW